MWGCVYRLVCNGHICCKPTIYLWTRYEKSFDKSVIFFLTLKKTFLPTAWHNSCWCWKESVTTESVLQDVLFTRCRKCSCPLSHSGSLINQSIGVPLCSRLQCLKSIWVDYQLYHYICFYIFMVTRGHILMTCVIPWLILWSRCHVFTYPEKCSNSLDRQIGTTFCTDILGSQMIHALTSVIHNGH